MLIAVISDTHWPSRRPIPARCIELVTQADLTLHAGDVVDAALLHELAAYGPLHVAMGNCDGADVRAAGALDVVMVEIEHTRIAMTHDSGTREGRAARMARRFPDAQVVVFGHSHQPVVEWGMRGQLLVNPGSPTDKRRAPYHTMALLRIDGSVREAELVVLD